VHCYSVAHHLVAPRKALCTESPVFAADSLWDEAPRRLSRPRKNLLQKRKTQCTVTVSRTILQRHVKLCALSLSFLLRILSGAAKARQVFVCSDNLRTQSIDRTTVCAWQVLVCSDNVRTQTNDRSPRLLNHLPNTNYHYQIPESF